MKYLQLQPNSNLPDISDTVPFRSVVIIEETVQEEFQRKVSDWLVNSGCLYMMAWGKNCKSWDDSVDKSNIKKFEHKEIPDENFVMTTWHDDEPLEEVFWFSKHCAFHPDIELKDTLLLHISFCNKENEFRIKFKDV